MSKKSVQEYLRAILQRYRHASKKLKKPLLDEFCEICGCHRKHAIRRLNQALNKNKRTKNSGRRRKPGRPRKYDHPELLEVLERIWRYMNLPCAKRLKAGLSFWVPAYVQHFGIRLSETVLALLATISPATIDRLLAPERKKQKKLGLATTKPGSLIKKHIPIKTNQWDEKTPGFLEADTVAHCGTSMAGMFVFTVDMVDIATGWTEQRAVWGKGERGVLEVIRSIEQALPFAIRGFDCDNGSEFLNQHLLKYFTHRKKPVQFTRSRPYHKNDNAHVEQKNWTQVRQYLGYSRFDRQEIVGLLNDLYCNEWRLFLNFFIPSVKLLEKRRDGSKIIKKYDPAKTPLQRVLESPDIKKTVKQQLQAQYQSCNPFHLQEQMKIKIKNILEFVNKNTTIKDN
jgi:hypothetical protein